MQYWVTPTQTWHPVMDSNHRMSESKSDALPTWRTRYKLFGVPPETRTPTKGFGDPRAAITPARQSITYALLPMRVIKHTVCDISVQVSSMCFITLGFYHLRYRRRLLIPEDALIISRCFECRQGRVPYTHFS